MFSRVLFSFLSPFPLNCLRVCGLSLPLFLSPSLSHNLSLPPSMRGIGRVGRWRGVEVQKADPFETSQVDVRFVLAVLMFPRFTHIHLHLTFIGNCVSVHPTLHVCLSSARAHITPLPPASCSDDMLSSRDVFLSTLGLLRLLTFTFEDTLAVENEGVQLRIVWAGEEQRNAQTPQTPKLREAARGEELIGGTVRQRGKKGYVAGKITGFDGRDYDVRLYNGLQMKWSEEDVRDRWDADQYTIRRGWTALDEKTLQTGVKGVVRRGKWKKRSTDT
jgi:hypothetical protein